MHGRARWAAARSLAAFRPASGPLVTLAGCLFVTTMLLVPAHALAQDSGGAATAGGVSSMFSNLANPAIGVNALFSSQAAPNVDHPYGLDFDEAEMSVISVVDPYWTFSSNIVFLPDHTIDPEEVWVRSTNIPAVQLKLGKLRGTFGKHGLLHAHAFPFVQAPIVMANTIGEEGFKDAGVEASYLTPLPWYSELTAGAYQAAGLDADHPLDLGSTRHDNIPLLGHFKNQFDVTSSTTLELGQSALSGWGADHQRHFATGADVTLRNVPARSSNSRGWILTSEYIQKGVSVWRPLSGSGAFFGEGSHHYVREADGGYASLQYRLAQIWWVGVRAEEARRGAADFVTDAAGFPLATTIRRASVNVAWTPSEFSFIRLEYSHAKADAGVHPTDDRLLLQFSYTIGYHPAHAY